MHPVFCRALLIRLGSGAGEVAPSALAAWSVDFDTDLLKCIKCSDVVTQHAVGQGALCSVCLAEIKKAKRA
jgi:hypothetical protein